ncbi:BREX-1 system adenine-specific DNA-methyltransferase PglX, partial [Natronomonas sp. F2-12]
MSTTHSQPGLSSDQRSTIRSTILSARHALEDELRRQLEKYGIYEDKRLPLENLTHLSVDEIHTRRTLDAAIERELESTEGDLERSITNYVREATKTYLNRFVALKTIEVRGLVEETITERPEYGNRSYIHHTVAEVAGELTNAADDGFGAALNLAYQEIGAEIRMIFEESEHTAIELDTQVQEEVLDGLDAIDDEAWESDEALGWVYQYFGEKEREVLDDRIKNENYKVAGTDIATKTQLFTPRYIVEWMVDNSLGRTWLEMYGQTTRIDNKENCFYLAPLEQSLVEREKKAVEDITVLDPACGSGHMLFYAFDVLYQMYLEEGEVPEKYIPREILRNNLFGIDIDSGAAQIAALSLYLKAKEKSPEVSIPRINIASADAVLINGDRKKNILENAKSEVEKQILENIWDRLDNLREFGSLIRIEELIDETLEEHRDSLEKSGQAKFTDQGSFSTQTKFVSAEGEEEVWGDVKDRLLQNVTELATDALEKDDPIESMFADEVQKTVRITDMLVHNYDIVVSNPPYLGSRKMNDSLKSFLKSEYTTNKDIYAAFIERNSELVDENGYMSMVTMETFMFQYNFRKLRPKLLEDLQFVDAVHLEHRDEGYMNICYSMRKRDETTHASRFKRLVHSTDKVGRLTSITESLRNDQKPSAVYDIDQDAFLEIDRTPFVYWFGESILSLFGELSQVEDISTIYEGLSTGDDDIFIRSWWEVDESDIGDKYRPVAMGGEKKPYYDSTEKVVLWENEGEDLRGFGGSYLRNENQYGKPGLNYKKFGNVFLARLHPEGWFFTPTSRLILPIEGIDRIALLGYLNSSVVRYIMNGLNPGVHFNINAVNNVPVQDNLGDEIHNLSKSGVDAVQALGRVAKRSRVCLWCSQLRGHSSLLFW